MTPHKDTLFPLSNHIELNDEVYTLLCEENRLLREGRKEFHVEFIERKRGLIQKLELSAEALKKLNQEVPKEGLRLSELLKVAQNKMMKNFILNKENEVLLQQNMIKHEKDLREMPTSKSAAAKVYGKN